MKKIRHIFTIIFLFFTINVVNTGCDLDIDELSRSMDQANDTIKHVIPMILEDSDEWKSLITDSIMPFIDSRLTWLIDDLNALVAKTTQEMTAQVACVSDQLGPRVTNGLKIIVTNIDGMRRSSLVFPMACSASPSVLDLRKDSKTRRTIQVNGFDFLDRSAIKLYLSKNGNETIISQNRIGLTSPYLFNIDVSNWDDSLRPYDRLVVRYGDRILTEVLILK